MDIFINQATHLTDEEKRTLGAYYTDEKNILKVIRPLFLDELNEEFDKLKNSLEDLRLFHKKISDLKFLDPACGSGNFLIVAYINLLELESKIIDQIKKLDDIACHKVKADQFYGIDIDEKAVDQAYRDFELLSSCGRPQITVANALRIDWNDVVPKEELNYIMGNPPFVGYKYQSHEQQDDMALVFGKGFKKYGVLDYVAAWYKKACDYIFNTKIDSAFVSTNSISQGEQPAILWEPLMKENNTIINFAHRTFKWGNEAKGKKAQVHCVIIGFSDYKNGSKKKIFDSNNNTLLVEVINPYLNNNPIEIITMRQTPICEEIPKINKGSHPTDNGNYIFLENEMKAFIKKEPLSKKYFKRWIGADDMINGYKRYILYLKDCPPFELKKMKEVLKLVDKVRLYRASSPREATRKKSLFPTLLTEDRVPHSKFLVVPVVSSEKRKYIPIEYKNPPDMCYASTFFIENAALYHFGILTSSVHMAWMRAVAGRLKSDYRYSSGIVYNNFIWPNPTPTQKENIEKAAQAVLDARKLYPDSTLADLYDPNTMPPELTKAHERLDKAVKAAYGKKGFETEEEIVASLMKLYKEAVEKENNKRKIS